MLLKRIYDHDAPKEKWSTRTEVCRECDRGKVVNAARDGVENCLVCGGDGKIKIGVPPVSGITMLRAGPVQRFTQHFINGALKEGWLSMGDGRIMLASDPPLTYQIVRVPGSYCCHCDEAVPGGASLTAAEKSLQHVSQAHPGAASPDPTNPAGYRTENCYTVVLEEGSKPIDTKEATAMDKQVREALAEKVQQKYGAVARRDADGGDTDV